MRISGKQREKVIEFVDVSLPNSWDHFKDGVLRACDEVYGKIGTRCRGDKWWRNEDVMKEISRKKDSHKVMCRNCTEENKNRYKSVKNKAKKVVSKAMREKAEETFSAQKNCPNGMLRLAKGSKIDSKDVKGICMRGSDIHICLLHMYATHVIILPLRIFIFCLMVTMIFIIK